MTAAQVVQIIAALTDGAAGLAELVAAAGAEARDLTPEEVREVRRRLDLADKAWETRVADAAARLDQHTTED